MVFTHSDARGSRQDPTPRRRGRAMSAARRLVRLALPAIGSLYLQSFYANNDAFWCGRLGPEAAGALGLFMLVLFLNIAWTMLVAKGAQSYVAQSLGAGDRLEASAYARQSLTLAVLLALVLMVIGLFFAEPMLRFLGGSDAAVALGADYLTILYIGAPLLVLAPTVEAIFQGAGDTKTPLKLMAMEIVVNASLSPLLAIGLGLGIRGLALATVAAWAVATTVGLVWLCRGAAPIDLAVGLLDAYRPDPRRLRALLGVGVPAAMSTAGYCVIYGMVARLVISPYGDAAFGAFGIGVRGVEGLAYRVFLGLSIATATLVGHEVGAGRIDGARRMAATALLVGSAPALFFSVAFVAVPDGFARIYTDDPEVLRATAEYVRVIGWVQWFGMAEAVAEGILIGRGRTAPLLLVSVPGNVLRIPLAWWLAGPVGLGLHGVWWAVATSMVVKGVALLAVLRFGRSLRD